MEFKHFPVLCRSVVVKIPCNPLVDHAIELVDHKREIQTRIELLEHESVLYKLRQRPKMKEPVFKIPLTKDNIPMKGHQTRKVLQKRLAILTAHGGFTRKSSCHISTRGLRTMVLGNVD
jgi:hypothetical protein